MKFIKTLITPEIAKDFLKHNYTKNRRIKRSVVEKYTKAMQNNEWYDDSPECTIIFDENGTLIDGQHRLEALIASNTSHSWIVVKDAPVNAFEYLNAGSSRSAKDYITGTEPAMKAALAKNIVGLKKGMSVEEVLNSKSNLGRNVSRIDIINEEKNNSLIEECCVRARKLRNNINCGAPSTIALFIYLTIKIEENDALDEYLSGFELGTEIDRNILETKNAIMLRFLQKESRPTNSWLFYMLYDGYVRFRNGETTKRKLRMTSTYDKLNKKIKEYYI